MLTWSPRLFDGEHAGGETLPEELTQVRMGRIVGAKFPELDAEDLLQNGLLNTLTRRKLSPFQPRICQSLRVFLLRKR